MAEEKTTTEEQAPITEAQTETVEPKEDKRISAMARQINELNSKLVAKEKAEKAAIEAAEQERLKAAGNFEELSKRAEARVKEIETEYSQKERRLKLAAEFANVENKYTRAGLIAECPADMSPEDYAAKVRTENADLFQSLPFSKNTTLPQGARGGSDLTGEDWTTIAKHLNRGNPNQVAAAINKIHNYQLKTGKLPPGIEI